MVAFTAGAVLTAANLNTAFNTLTFRAVTGTSDTLVLADAGGAVSFSNASPITATVPPFSSVAYANGTVIELLNLGAGVVTVTAGVGVTLNGTPVTLAQNVGGRLIKTATNTWYFLPGATAQTVLQVVRATDVTNRTTTSTSMVDASLSVTITPQKSDSRIFLIHSASYYPTNGNYTMTQITTSANVAVSGAESVQAGDQTSTSFNVVLTSIGMHSPGSISAQTYKVRFQTNTGTATLLNANNTGSLTAIEVAA